MSDSQNVSIDESGYPRDAIESLLEASESRFEESIEEYGPGKNWLGGDPQRFLWWANRNIAKAANDDGTVDMKQIGDALNYLAFAVENGRGENDG